MEDKNRKLNGSVLNSSIKIPEHTDRLVAVEHEGRGIDVDRVLDVLRHDNVVLARNLGKDQADNLIHDLADKLALSDALKLQAGFATFRSQGGQRDNIGKYFMSVTPRHDYQFITPHSEGSSFMDMQLASFLCYENTTDGGETILMNVDDASAEWQSLREQTVRIKPGSKTLTGSEIARARGLYRFDPRTAALKDDDKILQERQSFLPGLTLIDVLAKPQKIYSRILDRRLYVLWDSIGNIDYDALSAYADLLRHYGLLKEPAGGLELREMDASAYARRWSSGVDYGKLFSCKITCKLAPGDMLIQNNLTWTHSASNWSPESGIRRVAAAFA